MDIAKVPAYELIRREDLEDIHSVGYLLRHKKTGARVMILENDDDNKVFSIGFRTPPKDSTGVAHILEHSVLCGSREFPIKDPFVELAKGSLNTFLNAMTYPDRTVYPVASCNEKDFQNLMHVYLDAVFYPNIYQKEEIFRQEGWHYHLEDVNGPLTYNGVVYNEMKGAFSSADDVLDREILNNLFPDTPYGVESGGDPAVIPSLTYEDFLTFHRTYYHPSNSYIYLYGNADMVEKLSFMDEAYLSHFDYLDVASAIPRQAPFESFREAEGVYPIAETEKEEDNTFLAYNLVLEDREDPYLNEAFGVLDYALFSSPGAPVRQALLAAGIGKDIDASFEDTFLQSYFSIVARGSNPSRKEEFVSVIKEALEKVAREGVDEKAILAGLNAQEFRFREADYSSFPKGLMYGLGVLGDWIYKEEDAFNQLKVLHVYQYLREQVGTGYYENLIRENLLQNPHGCTLVLTPKKGLQNERDEALEAEMAAKLSAMTEEEKAELVKKTEDLAAFQEAEDSPEDIAKIPLLQREDLTDQVRPLKNEVIDVDGSVLLYHEVETNGIGYLELLFDLPDMDEDTIHDLALLKAVLSYIDTEDHTYGELNNEIQASTGGINFLLENIDRVDDPDHFTALFTIRGKALYEQLPTLFAQVEEIIHRSKLSDTKRLWEIVKEGKTRLMSSLPSSGHSTAILRCFSYASPIFAFAEMGGGINYYHFLDELDEGFEERKEKLVESLQAACERLFVKENFKVSYTGSRESLEKVKEEVLAFKATLGDQKCAEGKPLPACTVKNEGLTTSSQVQYVAQCGNFLRKGFRYNGLLDILKVVLSFDYLWMNVRVKGGAYGCMTGFHRSGESYFVSYRDPHLKETLSIFAGIPQYLRSFEADEATMTKYLIGAYSNRLTPLTPSMQGLRSKRAYFSGLTEEQLKSEMEEMKKATAEDIRSLAPLVESILSDGHYCAIGSEKAAWEDAGVFKEVGPLF